jgi:hypothetical protein
MLCYASSHNPFKKVYHQFDLHVVFQVKNNWKGLSSILVVCYPLGHNQLIMYLININYIL